MKKLFTLKFNYSNSTLIFTAFLMMITISCRKEMKQLENNSKNVTDIQIKNGRLIFESLEDFNSLMLEAHSNKTNPNYLQEKLKLAFGNDFHSLESYKEIQNSESQITLLSSSNIESKEPLAEKLVPDVIFASVLNQDGVIQIEKTVYKVTKFGTFMASEEKILKIDSLINAWESKNNTTNKQSTQYKTNSFNGIADDYLPFEYAQEVQDDFYSVANNIYLYDTFGYTNGNSPDFYELEDDLNTKFDSPDYLPNFIVEPPTYPAFYTIMGVPTLKKAVYEDYIYNSLETYDFGAKTLAGKLLESIRGRDEIHTVKFGDKNRVRVNFYDASYIIYAAIGVSVQMQTKNWVGWGQINADELRIGWDVIRYNAGFGLSFTPTKVGYINPNTIPPHYTTDIPGSNHKFEIFDISVLGFRFKPIISYNDRKLIQIGIKEAFDFTRSRLSPAENKSLENIPSAYVTLANGINDDRIVTVEADEERSTFNKKMSRTFDWRTGTFSLKYNSQTGLSVSGEIAKSFDLDVASIYGIAKYANQWKGVRIIKN